jgi:beta-lactam-binding protein with PASTA domain
MCSSQSADANASCQAAVPDFRGDVTATDNCTAARSLVITQSPAAGTLVGTGTTNITITVKDAANNSSTCTTTFTVADVTAPIITACAPARSADANANCQAAVPDFTGNVTATDNCTAADDLVITQSPAAGTLVGTGVTNVTIRVTDAADNENTCTTTFTVADVTAPNITVCAPAQSADANGSCQAAVPDFTGNVTATDNCTAADDLVITQSPAAGTLVGTGVTNVTIRVTDAADNEKTCTTTFTVADVTAPNITVCAPAQSADANGSCQAAVPDFTGNVTATDNCTAADDLVITQSPAAGTLVGTGVTNVTIRVTDAADNEKTCTTTFTVTDVTAPNITVCAPGQSANANGSCQAAVPNFTGNVTATDNCGAAGLVITQSPVAGTMVGTGTTNVTITVKDAANNSSTCTTTFTVTDNTAPSITCPSNITLSACQSTATWTAPNATDNCPGVTVAQTAGPASGSNFANGTTTTITYTATDASGNRTSCSFYSDTSSGFSGELWQQ